MRPPYWVYLRKLATPLCFNDFGKLLLAASNFTAKDGLIEICHGRLRYRINGAVISLIANNYFDNKVTVVSFCGESYPLESIDDIKSFLSKVMTERFYVDGAIIRALTNPVNGE